MSTVREATPGDAAALIELRVIMLESVGRPPTHLDWVPAAVASLTAALVEGSMIAVVAEADGEVVSGGIACFWQQLPGVDDDGSRGHVFSVATRPAFRRRGLGRAVVGRLVDTLDARGVSRIDLTASAEGMELYRSLGFAPAEDPLLRRRRPR